MSKMSFVCCAALASLLASACGGDDGAKQLEDGGAPNPSTLTPPVGMIGPDSKLDGGTPIGAKADAGGADSSKPQKPDPCASLPAHAFGSPGALGGCYSGCEQGYADCDGDISNGCEVALNTPDACRQCHALYCFEPAVCGQPAPTCQTVRDQDLFVSNSNSLSQTLSGLVAGKQAGEVIATGAPTPKAVTTSTLPPFGGALFATKFDASGPTVSWSATEAAHSTFGSNGRVSRFGDRLYVIDSKENEDAGYRSEAVLIVTDLDGLLLWNKVLGDPMAKLCAHHVAADAQNNVYLAYGVCEDGDFSAPKYMLNGVSYDSDDGDLLASFDATGKERWTAPPVTSKNKVCYNSAESQVLALASVGDRLFMVNEVCLAEVDVTSGQLKTEAKLYAEMNNYAQLRVDGAGNLYVGASSLTGDVLLAPNALTSVDDAKKWPGASAAQVSKYRPDLTHVWTRALAHRGTFGGTANVDAYFGAFDVTPAGNGMMVGQVGGSSDSHPVIVTFDSDGKTTGAAQLKKGYEATQVAFDASGSAYIGGGTRDGFFIMSITLE